MNLLSIAGEPSGRLDREGGPFFLRKTSTPSSRFACSSIVSSPSMNSGY